MDALGEVDGVSIGLEGREKVEMRLKQMETGQAVKASGSVHRSEQQKYQRPTQPIRQYNAESDVAMKAATNGEAAGPVKREKREEAVNGRAHEGEHSRAVLRWMARRGARRGGRRRRSGRWRRWQWAAAGEEEAVDDSDAKKKKKKDRSKSSD